MKQVFTVEHLPVSYRKVILRKGHYVSSAVVEEGAGDAVSALLLMGAGDMLGGSETLGDSVLVEFPVGASVAVPVAVAFSLGAVVPVLSPVGSCVSVSFSLLLGDVLPVPVVVPVGTSVAIGPAVPVLVGSMVTVVGTPVAVDGDRVVVSPLVLTTVGTWV